MPPNFNRCHDNVNFDGSDISVIHRNCFNNLNEHSRLDLMVSQHLNDSLCSVMHLKPANVEEETIDRFLFSSKRKFSDPSVNVVPQEKSPPTDCNMKARKYQRTKPDQCHVKGSEFHSPPPTHMAMPLHVIPQMSSHNESLVCPNSPDMTLFNLNSHARASFVPIPDNANFLFRPALVQPRQMEYGMLPPPLLGATSTAGIGVNKAITHFVHGQKHKSDESRETNIDTKTREDHVVSLTNRRPIKKRNCQSNSDKLYDAALALSNLAKDS